MWWVNRRAFEWPAEPTRLGNRQRHFQFAWGPSGGDKPLSEARPHRADHRRERRRKGTIWIDEFRFTPLPPEKPYTGTPNVLRFIAVASRIFDSYAAMAARGSPVEGRCEAVACDRFRRSRATSAGSSVMRRPENAPAISTCRHRTTARTWTTIRRCSPRELPAQRNRAPDLQTRWLAACLFASRRGHPARSADCSSSNPPTPQHRTRSGECRAARALRPLSAHAARRAIVLDDHRPARRRARSADQRGRPDRSRSPRLLDRAVHRSRRRQAAHVGGRDVARAVAA